MVVVPKIHPTTNTVSYPRPFSSYSRYTAHGKKRNNLIMIAILLYKTQYIHVRTTIMYTIMHSNTLKITSMKIKAEQRTVA